MQESRYGSPGFCDHFIVPGFQTFFIATAGLVPAQVVDPAAAGKIVGMIAGIVP